MMYYLKFLKSYITLCIYLEILSFLPLISAQYGNPRNRVYSNVTRVPIVLRRDQLPTPDTDIFETEEIHPLTDLSTRWHRGGYTPVKLHPCEQSSCYPATGNLLIGREKQLFATSTCGLHEKQRYCIVSHLEDPIKCFWCDSRPFAPPKPFSNHSINNLVYRYHLGTREKSWWQSENGKEKVTIQLNLEAEFHFTHLVITFKTFRPAAMLIERSYDFGKTWQVYRYFAADCNENFPGVPINTENFRNLTDVICETRYSRVEPSIDGELVYRVLPPPTRHVENPYSQEVQNLLKMTNLRINFTKLHTLGDDLLDKREEIEAKYYYAISDIVIRGSCSCYGHANRCLPLPGMETKPDMVHGRCECTHNTKGSNCEECEDFFNDLPWRPAIGKQTNACKKCNCNNHALSCHFDAAVYQQTGKISGGVCDGCRHNTMGSNCELCKPFYYKDPERDIQDPEACRPCDCDPHGSLEGGICDSTTDLSNGLEAGKCHCRTNVDGRRCDMCKNGFWNFDVNNPDGCQACTCSTLGTIDNQGCNMYTGECTCKRYVTGRDCNQCLPEYWGLSDKKDGCQQCLCDPGGSYHNNCDVVGGQCKCREHMTGRQCNIPQQQYFTASLDFLLYEAELAKASATCQVVIREPYRDGRGNSWTGTGFVRAPEGSFIEFIVDDIKTSMPYDIVIRYEPLMPNHFEEVTVTILRDNPIDPNGPCYGTHPSDDEKKVVLPSNSRSVIAYPPACLDAGHTYKIRLDFNYYSYGTNTPSASVLIDSIVLVPKVENIPWFNGSVPAQYNNHHCSLAAYSINKESVSEVCKNMFNSIAAYVNQGAFACQCDPTGSVSKLCEEYGGNCLCKLNVVGRRCNRCAPGTYGFGPQGCSLCDCNSIGASDNFCNVTTGQCKCRPNTYGRECDQCRTGFWNFPNCQRCDCNGHADTCDSHTGKCISCRDNTQGHTCDQCAEGYYGDPRLGVDIPCRQCPCPGLNETGQNFALRCSLDPYTKDVVCECKEGYTGARCNVCDNNYFGNPEEPGGSCEPCDCNDKTDLQSLGNCDPHNGKCLKCLYDTSGDHCEVCKPGYYRYDDDQICQECVCHKLGTNSTAGFCDPYTGQCNCYPNVIDKQCDRCAENYWKIASGSGCEACNCDPVGSQNPQCNLYVGQCDCKDNFGGRQCNECKANFWGDPKRNECYNCECDIYGSDSMQCNRKTGACVCRPGIGGYKCNECARGYLGSAPNCSPCGECFDNWDRILQGHKNTTLDLIERAKSIKKIGATGAYTKEFDEIQRQLDEIEELLNSTNHIDVDSIEQQLTQLKNQINETEKGPLLELNNLLDNVTEGKTLANIHLGNLEDSKNNLLNKIKELEQNGTALQEGDVQGALNLVQAAKGKADIAAHKAEYTQETVNYAERQCKATENLINVTKKEFEDVQKNNEQALNEIKGNLTSLNNLIPNLNDLVCSGRGDPCDDVCGGAGCPSGCGNAISCENGAKQQAESALSLTNKTESVLKEKEAKANDFIRSVNQLNVQETKQQSQKAFDEAYRAFLAINSSLQNINNMKKRIYEFLNQNHSTPEEIKTVAEEVLKKHIDLKPEEIVELAQKIKQTVESLTNIDPIIQATADDLKQVQQLKEDADRAKKQANQILKVAEDVKEALSNSSLAQEHAGVAIITANGDIDNVTTLLDKIGITIDEAHVKTNETSDQINQLALKINDLSQKITNNDASAQRVLKESEDIHREANNTFEKSEKLLSQYQDVKSKLEGKLHSVEDSKRRSEDLLKRAFQLISEIKGAEHAIEDLKSTPEYLLNSFEDEIQNLIHEMEEHNTKIADKESYYKKCT